eukprot:gene4102-14203_t
MGAIAMCAGAIAVMSTAVARMDAGMSCVMLSSVPFTSCTAHPRPFLKTMGAIAMCAGAIAVMSTAVARMDAADKNGEKVSAKSLSMTVAQVVSCTMAGTLTGSVLGPLQAVRMVGAVAARPLLAAFVVHRGVRVLKGRCRGTSGCIKKLQSGDVSQQIVAVRHVQTQANRGEKFKKEFDNFGDVSQQMVAVRHVQTQANRGEKFRKEFDNLGDVSQQMVALRHVLTQANGGEKSGKDNLGDVSQQMVAVRHVLAQANRGEKSGKDNLGDVSQQMVAVRHVLAQANRGEKFRKEFDSLGGIQQLLKILTDAVNQLQMGTPLALVILHALEALLKSHECKDSFVAAGGVTTLTSMLRGCRSVGSSIYCPSDSAPMTSLVPVEAVLAVLSHLSDHPLAQDAMREAGALPALLELAATGKYDANASLQSVKLLQSLALDPFNKQLLGQAGVRTLLSVIQSSEPKSELQAEAVTCLHTIVRGNYDNQSYLAHSPSAALSLGSVMKAMGPCYASYKPDLHALLNILARFPNEACHSPSSSPADYPAPAPPLGTTSPEPGALTSSALTWSIPPAPSVMTSSRLSHTRGVDFNVLHSAAPGAFQQSAALTNSLLSASLMSATSHARSSMMSAVIPPPCPPPVYIPTMGTPPLKPPMSPKLCGSAVSMCPRASPRGSRDAKAAKQDVLSASTDSVLCRSVECADPVVFATGSRDGKDTYQGMLSASTDSVVGV